MAIKFKHNKNGELLSVDTETNKVTGNITTMGDLIEEEPLTPEQEENRRIRAEFEKKYNIKRK